VGSGDLPMNPFYLGLKEFIFSVKMFSVNTEVYHAVSQQIVKTAIFDVIPLKSILLKKFFQNLVNPRVFWRLDVEQVTIR
jgi:hypothetical protein